MCVCVWPGQPGTPRGLTCVIALHILACQNTIIFSFFYVINVWFMVNVTQKAFQTHLNLQLDLTLSSQFRRSCVTFIGKVFESQKQDLGLLFLLCWHSLGPLLHWDYCTFHLPHNCMLACAGSFSWETQWRAVHRSPAASYRKAYLLVFIQNKQHCDSTWCVTT